MGLVKSKGRTKTAMHEGQLIRKRFGEKFRLARDEMNFSRAKLAKKLGISPKTIQSWEIGRTFIEDLSLIPKLNRTLQLDGTSHTILDMLDESLSSKKQAARKK